MIKKVIYCFNILFLLSAPLWADQSIATAILPFQERGISLKGKSAIVMDLLFAHLIEEDKIFLVERSELDKVLQEMSLNLTGAVSSHQAIQVGKLSGAKVLITGSLFKTGTKTHLVCKIISSETSKVTGLKVDGEKNLEELVAKLAKGIRASIAKDWKKILPEKEIEKDIISNLKQRLKGKSLPPISISIPEVHLSASVPDPAVETEFALIYKSLGGKVIDPKNNENGVRVTGEAFSEFSSRLKNLTSVKARVEIKVLGKDDQVLAVDREKCVEIDLNEMIAGKSALQKAGALLAERIIPQLAE